MKCLGSGVRFAACSHGTAALLHCLRASSCWARALGADYTWQTKCLFNKRGKNKSRHIITMWIKSMVKSAFRVPSEKFMLQWLISTLNLIGCFCCVCVCVSVHECVCVFLSLCFHSSVLPVVSACILSILLEHLFEKKVDWHAVCVRIRQYIDGLIYFQLFA